MQEKEARTKILHLAAEIAETDDNNVPVLLKQYLQGIISAYLLLNFRMFNHLSTNKI